jgi:hypothetical protein
MGPTAAAAAAAGGGGGGPAAISLLSCCDVGPLCRWLAFVCLPAAFLCSGDAAAAVLAPCDTPGLLPAACCCCCCCCCCLLPLTQGASCKPCCSCCCKHPNHLAAFTGGGAGCWRLSSRGLLGVTPAATRVLTVASLTAGSTSGLSQGSRAAAAAARLLLPALSALLKRVSRYDSCAAQRVAAEHNRGWQSTRQCCRQVARGTGGTATEAHTQWLVMLVTQAGSLEAQTPANAAVWPPQVLCCTLPMHKPRAPSCCKHTYVCCTLKPCKESSESYNTTQLIAQYNNGPSQ